ncbi:hypothetical protein M9458_053236 [Cirrhinus mrigala]|uniref:Uncharacterized protein n=1 Tax=Cirrhinus mrigala TaxID=683832 RepID=A0ABD0MPB6_CIRMR
MADEEDIQTAAEAERLLNSRIASRRGKLGVCTRKMNEMKALLVEGGNVEQVDDAMTTFLSFIRDFKNVHNAVQEFLTGEEKENDHVDWYEPRMTNFDYFIKEVEIWKKEQSLQITVEPKDSVSNISAVSKRSGSSKASSAAKLAAAEKAALEARAKTLSDIQALQMEEVIIKSKIQMAELQTQIAAADAKIKVLKTDAESQSDVMIDSLEANKEEHVALEFAPVTTVPKTPLQRVVSHVQSNPKATSSSSSSSSSQSKTNNHSHQDLSLMVQKQKEMTDLMIMQQNLSLLPKREVPVFNGDPLSYQSFIYAFKYLIEDKTSSSQARLYFLEQFTAGPARDLVRSCLHMEPHRGYTEAQQLLKKYFGNEMKIANAYVEKALNWTAIKVDDGKSLHAYALYLRECCNAMQDLEYMDELNVASNLKLIVSKLPYKLCERWRTVSYESFQRTNTHIRFKHLVEFLETQSEILLHPVFGDVKDPAYAKGTVSRLKTTTLRTSSKGSSFVTSVTQPDEQTSKEASKAPQQKGTYVAVLTCTFCQGKHALTDCIRLKSEPQAKRFEYLKRNGHCFGCLKRGHMSKDCNKRMFCQICQRKHPTLLHINNENSKQPTLPTCIDLKEMPVNSALVSADHATGASSECALAIVPVQIKVAKGSKTINTYAFLDPGSSATFCTENLMNQLNVRGRRTEILLRTMGQERPVKSYELTGLEVGSIDGSVYIDLPKVYTQPKIPVSKENLLNILDLEKWPYLKEIELKRIDADIEILIGINVPKAMEPWQIVNSQRNGPYAVKTVLGWVVNGPLHSCSSTNETGLISVTANRISMENLKDLLIRQYNHDFPEKDYDEKREMSVEDKLFMSIATSSVELKNGHYHLPLPFRDKDATLPNNYEMAAQRMLNLAKRFKKDSAYANEYATFMEDVLRKGYAEKVPQEQLQMSNGHVWYIPHHGVYHKQKAKLRVVFDCSCSYKGESLNSKLLQGPDLTNPLLGVLLRFRHERIAIMADIEAMYYQVRVLHHHCDFLRFLWWPQGDVNQPLEIYRMNVHLFGAVSSPSIANFALKQTGTDNSERYSSQVIDTIKHSFYVDDCLRSVASVKEAIMLTKDLREACTLGGFTLNKWVSNSGEVLETIPQNYRAPLLKQLNLDCEKPPLERALGIQWNILKDVLTFRVTVKNQAPTRRTILSIVSSIYDPLGFLSPFVLKAKQILQRLCHGKYGWDEIIPMEVMKPWQRWLAEVDQLSRFEVDRCMKPENFGFIKTAELHHFCDASELGYGTVSYLKLTDSSKNVHVTFVLGKARVIPLKRMTVPRLELAAATLAVKVDRMLRKELHMELKDSTFWTDSTVVLKYIHNQTKRFHTYVANRIAVIHNLSQPHQWRYVCSGDNPADDASRGLQIESLLNSTRWLNGPHFLTKENSEWPKIPEDLNCLSSDDVEVKREITTNYLNLQNNATTRIIEHYSSWSKLLRAVAWWLRLKKLLMLRTQRDKALVMDSKWKVEQKGLTPENLDEAEKSIIRYDQQRFFDPELTLLRKGKHIKSDSSIHKLDPILDEGILMIGGRLSKAALPVSLKNPIILPKDSHVSKLILRDIHQRVGHSGRSHMLSKLKQRFWLPSANSSARKIIKSCVFCRRMQAKAGDQKMADLPKDRVTPDLPPFSHVGIDYFGPIEVKRGRANVKRWGVIFTCLTSRAIHLEVASTLDTDSCINTIRRFLCRRGPVLTIRTDCGTNFVSAQKELKATLNQIDHHKVQDALLSSHVKWISNPPFAAHFGGVWERLIRLVKKTLLSVLKQQTLDDDMLQTALCEVECILNDRPITTVSSDPNDLEPLTPNHLLQLKSKPLLPPGLFSKNDLYIRRRWKQVQYLADLFWQRWTTEYLSLMQQRQKWANIKRNFKVNDIVVIIDSTAPRNSWPLGRVVKTLPGPEGLVRSVLVKTKSTVLQRPITKLCLLLEAEHSD